MNSENPKAELHRKDQTSAEVWRFPVILPLLAGWDQDDVIFSEDAQFLKVHL
jgi:hypothetical protein